MKENALEKVPDFEQITRTALRKAYDIHEDLGDKGIETIRINQFGETALLVDVECERAVLDSLREADIPIRVISEEHGIVDIVENPLYLGILDGLDGSNRYLAGRGKERYGTMFGVFSNLDPVFDNYLVSGIMEHSTNKLFLAKSGQGVSVVMGSKNEMVHVSPTRTLDAKTRIYIDKYWKTNRDVFSDRLESFHTEDLRSFAAYFADFVSGNVDLVLACTRKGNIEPSIGYGLVVEAGGVMLAIDGTNVRDKKYREFGQETQIPIIAASTEELARELIFYLKRSNNVGR